MFGVRTSDRRVVNSSGPADRRVVVNGAGNNSAVVVVNHCEQALDETNEIAVVDASSQVVAPRPYGDVNNGSMLKHVYRYVQNNITLIDSLGRRVEWYKKRLSAKQDLVNQAIRDKQQLVSGFFFLFSFRSLWLVTAVARRELFQHEKQIVYKQ